MNTTSRITERRVWIYYYRRTIDHVKTKVDIMKVKHPDKTKVWKRLQNDLGKYHSIGFELLKDFNEIT